MLENRAMMLTALRQINNNPLVLFGPGEVARSHVLELRSYGIEPVCFTAENRSLIGTRHLGLPIYDFDEVKNRYPQSKVFISVNRQNTLLIRKMQRSLLNNKVCKQEDIVGYIEDEEDEYHRISLELLTATSQEQINRVRSSNGNLILFGINEYSCCAIEAFRSQGVSPSCICELEPGRKEFYGLPVFSISQALSRYSNRFVYIVTDRKDPRAVFQTESHLMQSGLVLPSNLICKNNAGYFYGCDRIEYALDFAPEAIRFCCVSSLGIDPPLAQELTSNDFDTEIISIRRDELRHENQTPEGHCVGCSLYKLHTWLPNRQISYMTFNPFHRCQLSCCYCVGAHISPKDKEITRYSIVSVLNKLRQNDLISSNVNVWIAGGEPIIYEEFALMLEFFSEHYPQSTVEVGTNCVRYSKKLKSAIEKGVARVTVSIDSGSRETYESIKGKDVFDAVCNNIIKYGQYTTRNRLKYILMPNNCDDANLNGFIDLCEKGNIHEIVISRDYIRWAEPFADSEIHAMRKLIKWAIANNVNYGQTPPYFLDHPQNYEVFHGLVRELLNKSQ